MTDHPDPAMAVVARGITQKGPWGHVYGPLDLDIAAGGLTILRAESGAGRTALQMTLAGRMKAHAGTIDVFGRTRPRAIFDVASLAGITALDDVYAAVRVVDLLTDLPAERVGAGHGAVVRHKAAILRDGREQRRDVAVAAEELGVPSNRVEIEQRQKPVRAVAAARGPDAVDGFVRKRRVEVGRAQRVRPAEVAAARVRALIHDRREAERRAHELIGWLGLTPHASERCGGFSKGMLQKVALAGALVHDPRLIILDEPLTGLDAGSARQVKDVLKQRVASGVTVIMTTHILEVAERMAERIGVLAHGRLIAEGTLAELRTRLGRESTLEEIFLELVAEPANAEAAE